MQVVLVMFRNGGQRKSFSITRDMTVIGRREDCDLRIPLGDVSRKHCRIVKEDGALRVEDLGSSNGTFINGERIQQAPVQAGDTLQVGPVVFVAQIDGTPADDELHPFVAPAPAEGSANGQAQTLSDGDTPPGEFDPMEALNSNEGSGFEFDLTDELAESGSESSDTPTTETSGDPIDLEDSQENRAAT